MQKSVATTTPPLFERPSQNTDEYAATARPRVLMATNIIPHYRVTFYEKLCRGMNASWLVLRGESGGNLVGEKDYDGPIAAPLKRLVNVERRIGPYTLRWQRGLWHELKRFDPDVVILGGVPGSLTTWATMLWARFRGRSAVLWACAWEPHRRGSLALKLKQLVLRAFYSLPDHCLVYSSRAQRYLTELGVDSKRITVCYNGLEIDHLPLREQSVAVEGQKLRQIRGLEQTTLFLYVGGMVPEKRLDLLLRALARLQARGQRCALWLVGDGPGRQQLEAYSRELGLSNVTFFGRVVEGVEKYFAAADFFVLPGVGGLAFNQAMYWSTPCIGGEADGTEEDLIVDGVTGKRFKPADLDSLVTAMSDATNMTAAERQAMGARGRQIILERSNVTRMVHVFHKTLQTILAREVPNGLLSSTGQRR